MGNEGLGKVQWKALSLLQCDQQRRELLDGLEGMIGGLSEEPCYMCAACQQSKRNDGVEMTVSYELKFLRNQASGPRRPNYKGSVAYWVISLQDMNSRGEGIQGREKSV